MRKTGLFCLLAAILLLNACSSGSSDAPADRAAHPEGWVTGHAMEAAEASDYADCAGCHGADLRGSADAESCYSCHAFSTSPPFVVHPDSWSEPYTSHRAYAALNGFETCGGCHGAGLRGSRVAPSCFANSVDGRGCHAEGPGEVPHPLGEYLLEGSDDPITYADSSQHGPEARQNLVACQPCHGEAGGPGDNPRFNVGIFSAGGAGCESCHAANTAHPRSWVGLDGFSHSAAGNSQEACALCHGAELEGTDEVVSCYTCHAFNTSLPLALHPAAWSDPYSEHRSFAALNGSDACVGCHGAGLQSNSNAPSCFSENFAGMNCHVEGPAQVPHPLDGSYLAGDQHGPEAKQDLTACQPCHGEAGGAGDNPRFNVGIFSAGSEGCESCHGVNYAHPQAWAGPNSTFHYTAGNIQNSCALCHGTELDGVGGVGVGCLECHASVTTFTLDCTACHGYPPDGSADVATSTGVDHSAAAEIGFHSGCQFCHGVEETAAGGDFTGSINYRLFDKSTETPGDHWNGKLTMNSLTQYDATTFGCEGCHANDAQHQMSDSGLPIEVKKLTP